jgi:Arc/MetJ-type ribon-helix-helix transcriptional regulator
MQISLSKPDVIQFLEEQVTQGRFDSPEAVVEAALALLQNRESNGLDPETLATIRTSREQLNRGEGRDIRAALGELRQRYENR